MGGSHRNGVPDGAGEDSGRLGRRPTPSAGVWGLSLSLAWLAGVAAQLQQARLWAVSAYAGLVLAALLVLLLGIVWTAAGKIRGNLVRPGNASRAAVPIVACALCVAAFGFSLAAWHAGRQLAQTLPAESEGVDFEVVGTVSSLPRESAIGTRFLFDVESARRDGREADLPRRLSLGWYGGGRSVAAGPGLPAAFKAGQRWSMTVRLKRPHGLMNPHGFDYELHLFEQGVGATGYVRGNGARLLGPDAGHAVQRLRQRVKDAIEAQVGDARAAGLLAGLSVGDQSAIDREDWDIFRATGVAHLVSISGLHVTMFAWLAGAVIRALWRRSARASLWWPAPAAAVWGGLAAALAYALFSGWGVPAQRTVWMLSVATLLRTGGRRWPWPMVLLAAAVAVTALDPWALLQPGFWLSFAAVGLLMASGPQARPDPSAPARAGRFGRAGRWLAGAGAAARAGLRTQVIATVGLAPLGLLFFQQVSLVGLLANLVAIPVVSFALTPLALAGAFLPPLWAPAAWLARALGDYLSVLASWPWASWTVAAAAPWAQCAALLGAALAALPLPWRLRVLALPLCLPLCLPAVHRPADGEFELLAVDVGQGTAVLVRTRRHTLLFDSGPQYSPESDAGQRVLLPLLQAQGERRIDTLMISHSDTDHVGGAATLLRRFPVASLSSSLPPAHPLQALAHAGGVPSASCLAGQRWRWDGVDFHVLHPSQEDYGARHKPNAMSCVLRVSAASGGASAVLTGDIERAQEARLVERHGDALRSEVLLVPHHGSKTSSTAAFLGSVRADVAVVQSGYRNRFGHPAPEVVRRLLRYTGGVQSSPSCGAWSWSSRDTGRGSQGSCWREQARRYWHHGDAGDAGEGDQDDGP